MELISRKDAVNVFIRWNKKEFGYSDLNREMRFIDEIESLPTIEERKEGKWVELQQNDDGTHNIQCSICRYCFKSKGHARSIYTREHFVYCPHCGARMKGE